MPVAFATQAQHAFPEYSREVVERLREIFVNNRNLSEAELSRMSEKWVGQHFTLEVLKNIIQAEGWYAQRNAITGKDSGDIVEEVNAIRRIVYEQIIYSSQKAILIIGSASYDEIAARLSGLDVRLAEINEVDPQLVNAYMNLLAKSKIDLNLTSASAKTSRQQALEAAREAIEEIKGRNG